MPSTCSIPKCVYSKKEEQERKLPTRKFFCVRRPEFAKTPEEREHRQDLTNILLQLCDSSKRDEIKTRLHRENAFICEKHFIDEDIQNNASINRSFLRPGAIPVLNVPKLTYRMKMRWKDHCRKLKRTHDKNLYRTSSQIKRLKENEGNSKITDSIKTDNSEAHLMSADNKTSDLNNITHLCQDGDALMEKNMPRSLGMKETMWNIILKLRAYCDKTYKIMDGANLIDASLDDEYVTIFAEIDDIEYVYNKRKLNELQKQIGGENSQTSVIITVPNHVTNERLYLSEGGEIHHMNPTVTLHDFNKAEILQIGDKVDEPVESEDENKLTTTACNDVITPIPLNNIHFAQSEDNILNDTSPMTLHIEPIQKLNAGDTVTTQTQPVLRIDYDNRRTMYDKTPNTGKRRTSNIRLTAPLSTIDGDSTVLLNSDTNKTNSYKINRKLYRKYLVPHEKWGEAYKCDCCSDDHFFKCWYRLRSHQNRKTDRFQFECKVCKKVIAKTNKRRHMYLHLQKRRFECEKCGMKFRQKTHLTAHLDSLLACKFPTYQCNVGLCGQLFMDEKEIHKHQFEMHSCCDVCSDKFSEKCIEEKHHIVLLKLYKCSYCKEAFTSRAELVRHTKANHKKEYSTREMKHHANTHKCEECNKTFSYPSLLTLHVKTHNKEGVHESRLCEYCSKYFKSSKGLRRHILTVHATKSS